MAARVSRGGHLKNVSRETFFFLRRDIPLHFHLTLRATGITIEPS